MSRRAWCVLVVLAACGDNIHPGVDAPPASLHVITTVTPDPVTAGDSIAVTCRVLDTLGDPVVDVTPALELEPADPGNTITGLAAQMTRAGHYGARCIVPGATGDAAPFDVVPALPAQLQLARSPDQAFYDVGDAIAITHVVLDRYGNVVPGATVTTTSSAELGGGAISENPVDVYSYAAEGRYRVDGTVSPPTDGGQPVTATVELYVNDTAGPAIACDGDATSLQLAPGMPLAITGSALDLDGIASLTVDGNAVTVAADGTFATTVPSRYGLNFVELTATDMYGATRAHVCTFLVSSRWTDPAGAVPDAVSLALTQPAVDDGSRSGPIGSFGDVLYTVLNSQGLHDTLDSALLAANPLKPSSCDSQTCVFGVCVCWYSSEVIYQSSNLPGPNTVSLGLVSGGIHAQIHVPNVTMRLRVKGDVSGIPYDTTGNVSISYVDIALTFDVGLSGGKPRVSVRPGSVSASVGSISTSFGGVDGWIINNVIVPLAQNKLRSIVQNAIQGFVVNNLNGLLDGIVSSLDVSSLGATFGVPRLDGNGTVDLAFGVTFSSLGVNPSRALFGLGTKFSATPANMYAVLGVPLPPAGNLLDPAIAMPSTVGVTAYVGVLQDALFALWRGGYFSATLTGSQLGANPDATISVETRLPPVVDLHDDGSVTLQLGAVDAMVQSPDLPASLAVRIGADAHASVTLSGSSLVFGGLVIDQLYISTDDPRGLTPQMQAALETLVQQLAQQVIDSSLNHSLPALPIPSFKLPAAAATYGLPAGASIGLSNPTLSATTEHFLLAGQLAVF